MTIDKSWTTLRNRNSDEFWDGLQAFLLRCKNHLNEYGRCRCPCNVCNNLERGSLQSLESHIHKHGFSKAYKTWTYHGEVEVPPVFQYTSQTTNEMRDVITDIRWENTTIEHNTNADETRNEPHESLNATNDDLDELMKLADTELYPGCDWMSSLNFLAKISHMKVINKWTDTSFDQLLEFLRSAFPKENKIPKSHYEAKKLMKKVGLGYESIHACKNDCCLFWNEYKDMQNCPICFESRWKDKDTKGKKIANKVLRYFPLTPRLKRMYSSRRTAKSMTWHATGKCMEDGKMRHPVDGTSWKHFDETYPDFAREKRNVRLGLAADGFNPYGNMSLAYSMWPVILTTYNTPPMVMYERVIFHVDVVNSWPQITWKGH